MILIEIVGKLSREIEQLRDHYKGKSISYNLEGEIIEENGEFYFKGNLGYRTNFEIHPPGTNHRRPLNAGRISFSPIKDTKARKNSIIDKAKEITKEEPYEILYDEESDTITIKTLE